MVTKTVRKIIRIDEDKCDGCGLCVPACAEGALQIIDGKARLVSEIYCDGLGACLGECPQDAIIIEEREAEEFDEEAVSRHLEQTEPDEEVVSHDLKQEGLAKEELPCGCPSATVATFARPEEAVTTPDGIEGQPSTLGHWPVQLTLVPPSAPFLKGADILLTADCVPFAYAAFHKDFLKGRSLLVACPKLDDLQAHLMKLTEVLRYSRPKSLTVIRMEVPCCYGLVHMANQAAQLSGLGISVKEVVIGVGGELQS